MGIQEKIDWGIELYREQRRIKAELKGIKAELREHAEKMRSDGETSVELVGEHGSVEVTFPCDSYKVSSKNAELVFELKDEIGDAFENIFDASVSYKVVEDFRVAVDALPHEKQAAVLELIDLKTRTPRVKFPK